MHGDRRPPARFSRFEEKHSFLYGFSLGIRTACNAIRSQLLCRIEACRLIRIRHFFPSVRCTFDDRSIAFVIAIIESIFSLTF